MGVIQNAVGGTLDTLARVSTAVNTKKAAEQAQNTPQKQIEQNPEMLSQELQDIKFTDKAISDAMLNMFYKYKYSGHEDANFKTWLDDQVNSGKISKMNRARYASYMTSQSGINYNELSEVIRDSVEGVK